MKDKRQGNDLKVAWSIFMQDGEPFRLDGKDVSLYLKNMFGRKELNDFVTTGNIIQWTFYGKDQKNSGKYSLELVINEGEKGMITTDKCDFVNLVSCSCKLQGGEDAPNVETESIELTSTLEYVSGGGEYDDTALWKELENKVDKVEGLGLSEENYTTEEKEKLSGLENYDDSGIKGELAKKAEKSEIPTKMSQLEQDVEIGSDYDDTEVKTELARLEREKADKSELTELSAEVSRLSERVDNLPTAESSVFEAVYGTTTYEEIVEARNAGKMVICQRGSDVTILTQLSDIRANFGALIAKQLIRLTCLKGGGWSYEMNDAAHSLTTLDNGNAEITIAGKTAEVVTPQNVGKQGVIRQTQTWTQAADKGYDYVMQNIVRGAIPQANIDLFTSAGAVFNEESGYFELNGLTDISYEEMSAIYNAGFKMVEGYWMNNIRTNIFRPCNVYNVDAAQQFGFTGMYANRNCKAESFKFTEQETYGVALKNQMYGTYDGCIYLKTFGKGVFFCQDSNISGQAFIGCYSLETIYVRGLKKDISFKDSARLSNASILYMVSKSAATSATTITLHADAYARAMADAEITAALEAHPNVSLASA